MAFAKASEYQGGSYFKPADHMNDLALLVEPIRVDKGVPYTDFNKKPGIRDEAMTNISVFATSEALEKGAPTEVIKNTKVVHGMLSDFLSKIVGQASVVRIERIPTKGGSGYVFRDVSPAFEAQVETYYTNREAAVAAAVADAPDFS